jgi:CBS domain-containing protein
MTPIAAPERTPIARLPLATLPSKNDPRWRLSARHRKRSPAGSGCDLPAATPPDRGPHRRRHFAGRHAMKIRDILRSKGREVVTVGPDRTVADAIGLLVEHGIGALVVVEGIEIRGIVSERDILGLAATDASRLSQLRIADQMTTDLVVGVEDDDIDYVMEIMTRNRVRHLPIVADRRLVGIVSIGDVVNALRRGLEAENRYLRDYVQGTIA